MTTFESPDVAAWLEKWGFAGADCPMLKAHAKDVIRLNRKMVGEIARGIGLAADIDIDRLISEGKADGGGKALDILAAKGVKDIARHNDRILAIQNGAPFIAVSFPQFALHPIMHDEKLLSRIREEKTKWGVIPMVFGDKTFLMFDSFDKMGRFKSLGKTERASSPLLAALASCDSNQVRYCCCTTTVFMEYEQKAKADGAGGSGADDHIQVIRASDASADEVTGKLVRILEEAIDRDVNDVDVSPNTRTGEASVFFRKYQRLTPTGIRLSVAEREAITGILTSKSRANPAGGRLQGAADGNAVFSGRKGEAFMRLSFIPLEESQNKTVSVSVRVLPRTEKNISMGDLNIPADLQKELGFLIRRKNGLMVVCGPTGSGKSTTIAGMLCEHNNLYGTTQKRISVEQPVERVLPGVRHIDVSQHRYAGKPSSENFSMALRAILRHDPDVIFVGEVRDKESCTVSIDAANTGHLVMTTTHANSPILGYRRLASFLDKERWFDLVNVIEGILAQRLVTTVCKHCSSEVPFTDEDRLQLEHYADNKGINLEDFTMPAQYRKANHEGCKNCIGGYAGMLPVHGLMVFNPEVRRLLLSGNDADLMAAETAGGGKFTLFGSAFSLMEKGLIDLESVML